MKDQQRDTAKSDGSPDQIPAAGNAGMTEQDHRTGQQDHPVGPTSTQGLEASESPDHDERGSVDTDPRKINARKLPANTGGTIGGDVGLRAFPDSADAKDHGHRKHN